MLEQKRKDFKGLEVKIGALFSRFGLSANQYTATSLFFVALSFYFLTKVKMILALIFFLFAGFLDLVDGAVARTTGKATKNGAYLDTICDRYVEGNVLLGFLFLPLPQIILKPYVWIFIAFLGSLMTTYSKAAAKEKELVSSELKKGFIGRGERIILIALAIILGSFNLSWTLYPIIALAIFSNLTALQRISLALNPSNN